MLTPRAVEGAALGLHEAEDGSPRAGWAGFAFAVVDAVGVLVAAGFVQGVAVGPVAES